MARKWRSLFCAVHTVLRWKRWQRFGVILTLGCTIALLFSLPLAPIAVHAQTDPIVEFEQGRQYYEAGEYTQAAESLNAAIAIFEAQDQPLQQAIALSNLALVHQAIGQWNDADTALADGFAALAITREELAETLPLERSPDTQKILAVLLNVEGKGLLQRGQATAALTAWQQATQIYETLGDRAGQLTSQLNQLQALQSLGLFQQANSLAQHLSEAIYDESDRIIKVKGLLNLGNVQRAIGRLGASQRSEQSSEDEVTGSLQTLEEAVVIAEGLNKPELLSAAHLSLGSTYQAIGNRDLERLSSINRQGIPPWVCSLQGPPISLSPENYEAALAQYEQAATYAPNRVAADLNRLSVWQSLYQLDTAVAQQTWRDVEGAIAAMPRGRSQVYAYIALAKRGACIKQSLQGGETITWDDIHTLLTTAVDTATNLPDRVAESYARGSLGGLYESFAVLYPDAADESLVKSLSDKASAVPIWRRRARDLTERALLLAQPAALPDIAFQWQWQLARLDKVEGKPADAIARYKQAVNTLEAVRGNLLTVDSDVQFSFRDNVEPVYRELVDLLLLPDEPSPEDLQEAIRYIDTLQLSELENFLQCSLATVELTETVVDESAANLYGIVLKDRLEVILARPNQDLQRTRHFIAQADFEEQVKILQGHLRSAAGTEKAKSSAADLYDWLIRPFESVLDTATALEQSEVKILIFVLDTSLRSIPMGVLHDSQRDRYLLERYAIATVPSLRVVEPEPLSRQLSIFAGGTSEELEHPFRDLRLTPLKAVKTELEAIQAVFPGGSDALLDDAFTETSVEKALERNTYSVVHLATHGEFSSDPERTFILLSDDYLNAREIDGLLRTGSRQDGIKLLVLSACKTATGDQRATLGLAGLTVRAGSRSTLATLWQVDDASTAALMQEFYQTLKDHPEISKVEALRRSQLALWDDPNWRSPLHWAPYVMVGNWR